MNAATTTDSATTAKVIKKTKKAIKAAAGALTLRELSERYLKHLQTAGKSAGTCFSYSMDLAVAQTFLGADTAIASLTPERVREYFESDVVIKTRKGREKATPTILKTRRVLRLALCWAAERKLIDKAPGPAAEPTAAPTEQA